MQTFATVRKCKAPQQQLDDASLPKLVHILHNVLNSCEKMCAYVLPGKLNCDFILHPVFSSQSAGSKDLVKIVLASQRSTLHDFMALSYGPARVLA